MKGPYTELKTMREKIEAWQQNGMVHPLTCGNDSQTHADLIPVIERQEEEYELSLVCPDCDWKQDIPPFFHTS